MTDFDTDHMDRFLKRRKGVKSDSTVQTLRAALKHFDEWLNETSHSFDEVGPLEIEDFLADLSSQGYAPSSVGLYFNNVREYYKFLVRAEIIEENPAESVDRDHVRSLIKGTRKRQENEIVYATEEEVEAMVEHAPEPRLRNRVILKTLYQTGIRAHECATIRLDNMDRDERRLRVRSEKTDDWRSVFYRPSLDLLLDEWIDGGYRDAHGPGDISPYLFPGDQAEHISSSTVTSIVKRAAELAGIQEVLYVDANGSERVKFGAHTLRHGFAVWYIRHGGDLRSLQRLLGHQDLSTTESYLELVESDLKESYQRVSAAASD